MKLYLDVSCLNRPFDDQSQERIRLEAEAVRLIFIRFDNGDWTQISSEMAAIEVAAIPDADRQRKVTRRLPDGAVSLILDEEVFRRAAVLEGLGLKAADALHVAAAESGKADAFLTCDDRLLKWSARHRRKVHVAIANPVTWLADHAGP